MPEGVTREDYVDEERSGRCGWMRRDRLAALADDGRDLWNRHPRARHRQAACRFGCRLVSELPDSVAVKVAPDEREVDVLAAELERLLGILTPVAR